MIQPVKLVLAFTRISVYPEGLINIEFERLVLYRMASERLVLQSLAAQRLASDRLASKRLASKK